MSGTGSTCRTCSRPIRWARTAAGDRPIPLDLDPDPAGNVSLDGRGLAVVHGKGQVPLDAGELYMPHHATCPNWPRKGKPMSTTPTEPESFFMVRRTDGEEIGDYSWVSACGPDDWSSIEGYGDDEDDPVEYELCRLIVEPVATRTEPGRSPVCEEWQGTSLPGASWVNVVLPTDGTEQTWPARDVPIAHRDTQEEADAYIAALPERFHLHTGNLAGGLIEVDRGRLTTEAKSYSGHHGACERCRNPHRAHPEATPAR